LFSRKLCGTIQKSNFPLRRVVRMSRFNSTLTRPVEPNTVNLAGGAAFAQDAKVELASLLLTNMVNDQFYRSNQESLATLRALVAQNDPLFAAKAAVFARNEYGMRSITHALAGELAASVKGVEWSKRFYDRVIRRPDDATEILAYYLGNYGKPVPNSLKKGLGRALGKFDSYQLAKYRGEGKDISLVDVVNLTHPKPTAKNADALSKLVAGTLKSEETWEAKLSTAGKSEDKESAKADAWRELLESRKIGYFALLKNLRNIAEQAPELVPVACELLVDEKLIRNSLVLPFRYITAAQQVQQYPALLNAISNAIDVSLVNVPDFGNAAVVVDGSGSMGSAVAGGQLSCKYVGSLFAAALFKKNHSDVFVFGTTSGPVTGLNPADSTLSIAEKINVTSYGHSTNFPAIFDGFTAKYDNVIIFSDMQAWVPRGGYYGYGASNPQEALKDYKRRAKADPFVFAFDLAGYGSAQFPERNVFQLAGFSDKTFDLLQALKTDRQALVRKIEAVEI